MTAPEEARAMLTLMNRQVTALGGMGDASTFDDALYGFHVQQAVELGLKSWLTLRGVTYPHTHDLGALLHLLHQGGVDTVPLRDFVEFNAFAVQYRYDVMEPGEPALNRASALLRVVSLRDRIAKLISDTPSS
jgi:HEPN domain-containing protein